MNLPTRLKVGKVKVKGETALVPLSCTGNPGKLLHDDLGRDDPRPRRPPRPSVTRGCRLSAGVARTVKLKLNRIGRHALARSSSHRLRAKLTVHLGAKRVALRTVTFKRTHKHAHEHKHKHKR